MNACKYVELRAHSLIFGSALKLYMKVYSFNLLLARCSSGKIAARHRHGKMNFPAAFKFVTLIKFGACEFYNRAVCLNYIKEAPSFASVSSFLGWDWAACLMRSLSLFVRVSKQTLVSLYQTLQPKITDIVYPRAVFVLPPTRIIL